MSMKYLFLNLCTLDVLGRLVLCGGDFVHCKMFSHIPCFYPLEISGTPIQLGQQKVSPDVTCVLLGEYCPC